MPEETACLGDLLGSIADIVTSFFILWWIFKGRKNA